MSELKQVLMDRDGLTSEEADQLVDWQCQCCGRIAVIVDLKDIRKDQVAYRFQGLKTICIIPRVQFEEEFEPLSKIG